MLVSVQSEQVVNQETLNMQKLTVAILLTLAVATADVVEPYTLYRNASEIGFQLESPQITDFGSWGEPDYCRPGQIVTGFQLKVEPKHSIDDTALNGIRFFCGTPGGSEDERTNITSKVGYFGNWGKIFNCSTYAVGFELQSQEYQGPRTDDIAANNFKLYCADGVAYEGYNDNGHTFTNSVYTGPQMCSLGQGLCGIQTQVERYQVFGKLHVIKGLLFSLEV